MNWLRTGNSMTFKPLLAALAACSITMAAAAHAQDTAAEQPDAGEGVTLELNKLETSDKGCRAYVVVSNPTQTTYDALKLDLVLFQTDGVVGRRLALDLAPVRPDKKSVKLFELDGTKCDEIGSFLVNDVMECRTGAGAADDCLARLKVKSLTKVQITK
jgi:hypothetical protein